MRSSRGALSNIWRNRKILSLPRGQQWKDERKNVIEIIPRSTKIEARESETKSVNY